MKKLRNPTLLIAILVSLGLFAAFSQERRDARVAPEDFLIFPWDTVSGGPRAYQELHECGFNHAGFAYARSLDDVHAAVLHCFVADPRIKVRDGEGLPDEEIIRASAL